jgi:hypothetical protein
LGSHRFRPKKKIPEKKNSELLFQNEALIIAGWRSNEADEACKLQVEACKLQVEACKLQVECVSYKSNV